MRGSSSYSAILLVWAMAIVCVTLFALPVSAAVFDVTTTDVTPRAFSVVWVSDEPIADATIKVYADADGLTELTGGLSVTLSSFSASLALGIAKVDVAGLAPSTCYYFQTETTGTGTVLSPAAPPFTQFCTAAATRKASALDEPIANDLICHDMFEPDGLTAASGALLVLSVPSVGAHPLAGFMGDGFQPPVAAVDLNNLFDASPELNAELTAGDIIRITEFRGLLCPGLAGHQSTRFRRVPDHEEISALGVPVTDLEFPDSCFFTDTFCDDTIDILDAQRVLTAFGSQPGSCAFNPDLDIVADQVIDILDVQSVLNRFGQSAPFN